MILSIMGHCFLQTDKMFFSVNREPNQHQHARLFLFTFLCHEEDGRESLVYSILINTLKN